MSEKVENLTMEEMILARVDIPDEHRKLRANVLRDFEGDGPYGLQFEDPSKPSQPWLKWLPDLRQMYHLTIAEESSDSEQWRSLTDPRTTRLNLISVFKLFQKVYSLDHEHLVEAIMGEEYELPADSSYNEFRTRPGLEAHIRRHDLRRRIEFIESAVEKAEQEILVATVTPEQCESPKADIESAVHFIRMVTPELDEYRREHAKLESARLEQSE